MLVKELVDKDEDMTQYGRTATIKDTYDFILQDLKDAASGLRASEPTGMPTKGAAYALLAEAALHGAAYIESGQSEYYEIARQASEDLFALNVYSLDTDYKNMFNDFDHSQNSKEIILAQWKSSDNTISRIRGCRIWFPTTITIRIRKDRSPCWLKSWQAGPSLSLPLIW